MGTDVLTDGSVLYNDLAGCKLVKHPGRYLFVIPVELYTHMWQEYQGLGKYLPGLFVHVAEYDIWHRAVVINGADKPDDDTKMIKLCKCLSLLYKGFKMTKGAQRVNPVLRRIIRAYYGAVLRLLNNPSPAANSNEKQEDCPDGDERSYKSFREHLELYCIKALDTWCSPTANNVSGVSLTEDEVYDILARIGDIWADAMKGVGEECQTRGES